MSQVRRYALFLVAALLLAGCIPPPPPPPAGDTIVFSSDRTGSFEIWSVSSDGSNATQLTNNSEPEYAPDLSRDGTRIAFVREVSPGTRHVWVMHADGSDQHEVLAPSISDGSSEPGIITRDREPSWSPDDTRIAFIREGFFTQTGVLKMNADGSDPQVVLPSTQPERLAGTAWSPTGTEIAYSSTDDCCLEHLDAVNADGSGSCHITAPLDANGHLHVPKKPSLVARRYADRIQREARDRRNERSVGDRRRRHEPGGARPERGRGRLVVAAREPACVPARRDHLDHEA